MKIYNNKKAFTLAEAFIVFVIIGVISVLYSGGIKLYNPTQKGFEVQSQKLLENIDQVFTLILAKHSDSLNLEDLKDEQGNFSITDADATSRFANLFKENVNIIEYSEDTSKAYQDYYASTIKNFDNTSTEVKLNEIYSNFMSSMNGTLYGFRTYQSCSSQETNANPPLAKERKTVNNICGSIFYDVNSLEGPNKLGSDQYIIPFDALGSEIKR